MADKVRQDSKIPIVAVIVGLAAGIGLVLLFSLYSSSGKAPSSVILPPNSHEQNLSMMPADFSVTYAYGIGARNILDTANNTFTHDMVVDPPIVVNLTLSREELSTIWNSTQHNDFFRLKNLTDSCPPNNFGGCTEIIPEKEYKLTVTANGQTHIVMLRQNYELNQAQDIDLHKFKNITSTIDSILSQKEELKELPKPRGGYL